MLHAVIMAGGSGKRLWPQSRQNRPKPVLALGGARPMIAETIARIEGLVPIERTWLVTHESHVRPILDCLGTAPAPRVIAEPHGRDTAACIGLAAVHIRRHDPDATMLVMPADQVIQPVERFGQVVLAAVEVADRGDALVTFGIKPRYPATGYGYIHRGTRVEEVRGIPVYAVDRFREKPGRLDAEEFIASGEYYWNSGIFCWRVGLILDCLKRFTPDLHAALERIGGAIATPAEAVVLREAYEPLVKISIDYAVMERAETVRVVEADLDWSDVGSWESVARIRRARADEQGNMISGQCAALVVANSLVIGDDEHLIGIVGLDDIVVVRTPDATLICARRHAEDVKELVAMLERKKGMARYL